MLFEHWKVGILASNYRVQVDFNLKIQEVLQILYTPRIHQDMPQVGRQVLAMQQILFQWNLPLFSSLMLKIF